MRFILVPGAGGQAWDWHRLVPLLGTGGHMAALSRPRELAGALLG
ncbi:hypothetical protein [Serinicoccus marinus]|nr:hypothetical protein [Serinicoccus marinus]